MSDYSSSTNPFGGNYEPHVAPAERVGFGPRLGAWIIDLLLSLLFGIVLGVLLQPLNVGMPASISENLAAMQDMYEMLGVDAATISVVNAWYPALTLGGIIAAIMYALIEGLSGASPGKRILGIVVANQDGTAGTTRAWMRRCLVKHVSAFLNIFTLLPVLAFVADIGSFLGFVVFIGCFFVLGQERLALHDRIATTAIYHREDVQ